MLREIEICNPATLQNKLHVLNSKIETQKTKLNECIDKNNQLKKMINFYREEKLIYTDIKLKLES